MATWLVVDDEPDIYDVLVAMFQIWGIEGVAFVDGTEAVQWVENVDNGMYTGELPEMAIIDVRLPGVEGHHIAARIRRSPRLGNMAIVLTSAYRVSPTAEKYIMAVAQADMFIEKPLPAMRELRAQLDSLIARRKAMAPHYPALFRPDQEKSAPQAASSASVSSSYSGAAPSGVQRSREAAETDRPGRPPARTRTDS